MRGGDADRAIDESLEGLRIGGDKRGQPGAERPGRRRRALVLGLPMLVVLAAAGLFVSRALTRAREVEVIRPALGQEGGAGGTLAAGGYVVPERVALVASKIPGELVELAVEVGDTVKEGMVIARLDDREYRTQVERARANLGLARATLARVRAGARAEEVRQAEGRLRQAEAQMENAENRFRRAQELFQRELIAAQERDEAEAQFKIARAQLRTAEEGLAIARTGPTAEEIAEAEARVHLAERELENARAQLENTVIRAPFRGTVIDRKAQVGDMLFPGEPEFILPGLTQVSAKRWSAIVRLADLTRLHVEVDLNETDLPKVRLGQRAQVVPDSAPSRSYQGELIRIYPMADRQKKTVQVRVRIKDPDRHLIPEVNARVTFLPQENPAASPRGLLIPGRAVLRRGGETELFVVRDGQAASRPVKVGRTLGDQVEVLEGLGPGEQVVVRGQDGLRDGDPVRVLPQR